MNEEVTMKETVNLIHGLKALGITTEQILDLIEFTESADPEILKKLSKYNDINTNSNN